LERRAARLARLAARHFPSAPNYKLQSGQIADGRIFLRLQTYFHAWMESWLDASLRHGVSWSRLRSGDDRLLQATRHLNSAPLDEPYPRSEISRLAKISDVHLTRLFLKEFGLSPRKYWDRHRLEFAKSCLETSLMPIKEISSRLGFLSDSHFVVWFRRLTSQRPGAFREKSAALPTQL
jgi:AraC-like DNA-binding protein